jgi:hypothetical protein
MDGNGNWGMNENGLDKVSLVGKWIICQVMI